MLVDEIRCTLSIAVLGCVDEFMGYIAGYYNLNDFVNDSVSRNTFGIEKYHFGVPNIFGILFGKYFELRKSTWAS